MRALTISAHGGLDRIEVRDDLPTPEIRRPTEVRVRVRAAAINHLDVFVVGGLPGVTITPPLLNPFWPGVPMAFQFPPLSVVS